MTYQEFQTSIISDDLIYSLKKNIIYRIVGSSKVDGEPYYEIITEYSRPPVNWSKKELNCKNYQDFELFENRYKFIDPHVFACLYGIKKKIEEFKRKFNF